VIVINVLIFLGPLQLGYGGLLLSGMAISAMLVVLLIQLIVLALSALVIKSEKLGRKKDD
jgi:hypothetical protein